MEVNPEIFYIVFIGGLVQQLLLSFQVVYFSQIKQGADHFWAWRLF